MFVRKSESTSLCGLCGRIVVNVVMIPGEGGVDCCGRHKAARPERYREERGGSSAG
jgi:hypothetical protein